MERQEQCTDEQVSVNDTVKDKKCLMIKTSKVPFIKWTGSKRSQAQYIVS